jgi:hypothetical protein
MRPTSRSPSRTVICVSFRRANDSSISGEWQHEDYGSLDRIAGTGVGLNQRVLASMLMVHRGLGLNVRAVSILAIAMSLVAWCDTAKPANNTPTSPQTRAPTDHRAVVDDEQLQPTPAQRAVDRHLEICRAFCLPSHATKSKAANHEKR